MNGAVHDRTANPHKGFVPGRGDSGGTGRLPRAAANPHKGFVPGREGRRRHTWA